MCWVLCQDLEGRDGEDMLPDLKKFKSGGYGHKNRKITVKYNRWLLSILWEWREWLRLSEVLRKAFSRRLKLVCWLLKHDWKLSW